MLLQVRYMHIAFLTLATPRSGKHAGGSHWANSKRQAKPSGRHLWDETGWARHARVQKQAGVVQLAFGASQRQ
jgi:hypothetical protein